MMVGADARARPFSLRLVGFVLIFAAAVSSALGWAPTTIPPGPQHQRRRAAGLTAGRTAITAIVAARAAASSSLFDDDEGASAPRWQIEGDKIIRDAAASVGATEDVISVEWSPGKIKVVVDASFLSPDGGALDDDLDNNEDWLEIDMEEGEWDEGYFEDEGVDDENGGGVDVTAVARAINAALAEGGEGSVGDYVATHHSIEVTTPGSSDVLEGDVMFDAYRGFDVIVEQLPDPKKKNSKRKIVEGKLVERDDDVTRVNVKGRIVKVKNESIVSVRLPKAKKEKGAR